MQFVPHLFGVLVDMQSFSDRSVSGYGLILFELDAVVSGLRITRIARFYFRTSGFAIKRGF